ncbi:MAG: restriction endonuclease subunit S [Bacteroidales bacterium]|nr:restriction endonuclease subunit S [Bacteroidales bacterium]
MDTKKLRQKILDLAIRGKLVPQDPNDEPASVLLERIRAEKERLTKEGKIKRSKKTAEDDKIEAPFGIPDSWEWVRLIDVCHIFGRIGFRGYTKEDLVPFNGAITLSPSNIIDGEMNYDNCTYISWEKYEESPEIQISDGDILLVKTGSSFGKCAYVEGLPQKATINPQFVVLKYITCNSQFLTFMLQSGYARKNYDEFVLGTAIPTFTQVVLGNMVIPLPPIIEQKRIVDEIKRRFSVIDELESNEDDLLKTIDKAKSKILDLAIHGKLVPQDPNDEPASVLLNRIREEKKRLVKEGKLKKKDLEETPISEDEIPFDIPDSWEWVRISDVVNVLMGQSPDGNDVFEAKEGDKAYEFHQGKICFTEKYITPSGKWCKFPSRIANKDSLLICVRAPIGDVNITQRSIGIGRGLAAMEGMGNISNMFLFYWMLAHKRCLEDQGTGSTFKAITVEVLKNQKIPLPPLAEQKRIVAKIEEAFKAIDALS